MIYCFDKLLQFDYSRGEKLITQKNNAGIRYDGDIGAFTTFKGIPYDIAGKLIFPRTGVLQLHDMTEDIIRNGGIPILSNEETEMIENWPKYFETKRRTEVLKGKDLLDPDTIERLSTKYGENIFIKTVKKNFSGTIPISLLLDSECAFYKALVNHLDDDFMVSEAVELSEDKHGKKEYRCFVINNEPYNISRFTENIFHEIDEDVLRKLEEVIKELRGRFPSSYVVDLLEYEKDGRKVIDVSEFNPPQASGLYLYNSVIEKSDDILHKKFPKRIATEFMSKLEECTDEGEMINTREPLFAVPGSFANDLRSACVIGNVGVTYMADIRITAENYASHTPILFFEPVTDDSSLRVTSDADLSDNQNSKVYVKKDEDKK